MITKAQLGRRPSLQAQGLVRHLSSGRPNPWTRFDPALGRGYRIGQRLIVPANSGFFPGLPPTVLANHGDPEKIFRWKVTCYVTMPDGVTPPVLQGSGLRFVVRAKMENDNIPRTAFVTLGDAQALYAPGRSISVLAFNPNSYDLLAEVALDEYVGGISVWEDTLLYDNLLGETELVFPPFCSRFQVYTQAGAGAAEIRAYDPSGVIVYSEVLAVPRSGLLDRLPNTLYTIRPTGAPPQTHQVLFVCDG